MNYLLAAEVNPSEKLSALDALSYGGGVVLLGMATVFAVLIILWVTLIIFKFFFHDLKLGTKIKVERPVVEKAPEPAPAPVYTSTDDEIVAVIAAAIAAAESESANGAKFRVVSFKRK